MKTLQEQILAQTALTYHERPVMHPRSIILLLHGLNERGRRIYRKLVKYLPDDAHILAPNAPLPLPRLRSDQLHDGYAWYVYDRRTETYEVDQTIALKLLGQLLSEKNPHSLPVTVIGFSQGGYLAPLLGMENPSIKTVIGLGCEFRDHFFQGPLTFSLHGLHGENDTIIFAQSSREMATLLQRKSLEVSWELIPETGHEISPPMGEAIKRILDAKRSL